MVNGQARQRESREIDKMTLDESKQTGVELLDPQTNRLVAVTRKGDVRIGSTALSGRLFLHVVGTVTRLYLPHA
mgnify:FL=1